VSKLTPRDASKRYKVSRSTLMKALASGAISAEKTDAGHYLIEPSELARLYEPRNAVSRSKSEQIGHTEPDVVARLAIAEAALASEKEKNEMLQRHLDDVRRMLPQADAKPRRWWPFG